MNSLCWFTVSFLLNDSMLILNDELLEVNVCCKIQCKNLFNKPLQFEIDVLHSYILQWVQKFLPAHWPIVIANKRTDTRIYILCEVSMSKSWLFDNWFVVIVKHKLFTSDFVLMHLPCWQFCHKAVHWKLSLQIPSNFNNVV